ncbi:MAG: sel1 repeat family protein [Legionellales bacterium]|nr:sel1 repeat family protein [Legionellales bacterium]
MRKIALVVFFPQLLFASYLVIPDTNYIGKRPCITFDICENLANAGNEYARTTLGLLYIYGKGKAPKDVRKGLKILRYSAKEGDYHLAQAILGFMYKNGDYFKENPNKSATWMLRAAIHGFAIAQYHMGKMYLEGYGVNENLDLAVYWIKQAASRGQLDAMKQLGIMYIQGKGVEMDIKRGEAWMKKALGVCPISRIRN